MAIIKKDYLKIGGHNFQLVEQREGGKYVRMVHECVDCGSPAHIGGGHGKCDKKWGVWE